MLFEQFRSVLPSEIGVFVDQRNVSSAAEMATLVDLFYESNKDRNVKVNAKGNFNSCNNHYAQNKNCAMLNDNTESNKNGANAGSEDKKTEIFSNTSAKTTASQNRCFYCKTLNHRRSE